MSEKEKETGNEKEKKKLFGGKKTGKEYAGQFCGK